MRFIFVGNSVAQKTTLKSCTACFLLTPSIIIIPQERRQQLGVVFVGELERSFYLGSADSGRLWYSLFCSIAKKRHVIVTLTLLRAIYRSDFSRLRL